MSLRKTINKIFSGSPYCIKKINPALNSAVKSSVKINIEYFLAKLLVETSHRNEKFFFVQIGANDGVRADDSYSFITRHKLNGIVVEPLIDMFKKLSDNYADHPQITKINKAIHSSAKELPIYRVKNDANVPDWSHGIASFDRDHLLRGRKKIPLIDKYIIEEKVACLSLSDLFAQTKTTHISFLQIDTEGYDFEIIKMIDFEKLKPAIIRYECNGLSKSDNQACIDLLFEQGYQFYDEGNDIIAVLNK